MNKYKVKITHLFSEIVDIEADSKEDAKQKTLELIQSEGFEGKPQYETTAPPEHWAVITEDEFEQMVKDVKEQVQGESSNIITP